MDMHKIEVGENSGKRIISEEKAAKRITASVVTKLEKLECRNDKVKEIQINEGDTILHKKDKDEHDESEEIQDEAESESNDTFICDSDDEMSECETNDGVTSEAALTESEVEELISEFLDVESKAAEAQESLEKESLTQVENEVKAELSETLQGAELEDAVSEEMKIYIEQWESTLNELETESSLLLEQLDGAGVELPKLFALIESRAADCCSTKAWKRRIHWVGGQLNSDLNEAIIDAENYLQSRRPVRKRHGRVTEEGASGFLAKKLMPEEQQNAEKTSEDNWAAFSRIIESSRHSEDEISFGSKKWASVYLASTPQQASLLGLDLPGVDEVEEIDEIPTDSCDPFFADAIANEKSINMSEEQGRNFRKVKEEDDVNLTRKLQHHLKKRRQRIKSLRKDKRHQLLEKDSYYAQGSNITSSECDGPSVQSNSESATFEARCTTNGDCSTSKESKIPNKRGRILTSDSEDDIKVLDGTEKYTYGKVNIEGVSAKKVNEMVDVIDIDSDTSTCPTKSKNCEENFNCSVCHKVLIPSEASKHPLLEVTCCIACYFLIKEKMRYKGFVGAESFCGWCGKSDDLLKCELCPLFFCITCINKTVDEKFMLGSKIPNWQCFCCSPSQLTEYKSECERAFTKFTVTNSGKGSESSDPDIDDQIRNKRRKKKIRRILEDAELGEETKEKIAIEKARQEHLKLMQFKGKSTENLDIVLYDGSMESSHAKVLGDEISGYIINVAREDGEEPIRIPPSMSRMMKPHQISGVRFMWENIIQSVQKIKSGDGGLGCILAHTMGLGKTFQVIALLYAAMRITDIGLRRAIIVTPVNALHNWRHEFIKWKPIELKALRVFMMDDVPRERRVDLLSRWENKGGVLLIGYSAFRNLSLGKHVKDKNTARQICQILRCGPDILICDEAHMIKNRWADITFALKQVKTQRRIALTGSPLQNNLMEYYCMVDFVREGFLGSSHEFRNRFQNPIENGQHANSTSKDVKIMNQRSHILYEQLKGFVHRMDFNVAKKDLPPKTVFVITVKLSSLQRKLYKRFLDVHGFTSDKVSNERSLIKRCFFSGYQALAQIWNHPGLLQLSKENKYNPRQEDIVENFLMDDISSDDNIDTGENLFLDKRRSMVGTAQKPDSSPLHEEWWEDLLPEKIYREMDYSGKMVLLLDILSMSYEVGDKVLVFSQSLSTLDLIELFLSRLPRKENEDKLWKQGKDWYRLDGRTAGSERQRLVEKFNDPTNSRVKCTLISTRAGSLGINLHAANRVVIVDGSWNPTNDLQAIYRVWRYGQTKPVYAYRLMAHGTMEEKIYKRQVTKEGMAARVVDRQQIYRTMSREEVLDLFDFGDDDSVDHTAYESPKNSPFPRSTTTSDKFMDALLQKHHSRWISNYHEHESLLQENEDEKLTKEEQDMAWEIFRKTMEWEEVQRTIPVEDSSSHPNHHRHQHHDHHHQGISLQNKAGSASKSLLPAARKCSNLSHLLTLRSQGIKAGSSTICGECSQEISWESLNKDGRSR